MFAHVLAHDPRTSGPVLDVVRHDALRCRDLPTLAAATGHRNQGDVPGAVADFAATLTLVGHSRHLLVHTALTAAGDDRAQQVTAGLHPRTLSQYVRWHFDAHPAALAQLADLMENGNDVERALASTTLVTNPGTPHDVRERALRLCIRDRSTGTTSTTHLASLVRWHFPHLAPEVTHPEVAAALSTFDGDLGAQRDDERRVAPVGKERWRERLLLTTADEVSAGLAWREARSRRYLTPLDRNPLVAGTALGRRVTQAVAAAGVRKPELAAARAPMTAPECAAALAEATHAVYAARIMATLPADADATCMAELATAVRARAGRGQSASGSLLLTLALSPCTPPSLRGELVEEADALVSPAISRTRGSVLAAARTWVSDGPAAAGRVLTVGDLTMSRSASVDLGTGAVVREALRDADLNPGAVKTLLALAPTFTGTLGELLTCASAVIT